MLANINLDDEMFSEIAENAKKLITKYSPEWTDFNAHDPGITFLELFAWMKEIQQYRMNRIGDPTRQKFLRLLGIVPDRATPARAYITVDAGGRELTLPAGTPFFAGNIRFETDREHYISGARISDGLSMSGGKTTAFPEGALSEGNSMHFYIFGREPKAGDEFRICLTGPVAVGRIFSLYFSIFDEYEVKRNQPEEGFLSLADISWEYFSGGIWKSLEVIEDQTSAFTTGGCIRLRAEENMTETDIGEAGRVYVLRALLKDGSYDVPPVLTGITINSIPAVQRETLASYRDASCQSYEDMEKDSSYDELHRDKRYFVKKDDRFTETTEGQLSFPCEVRIVSFSDEFRYYMEPGEGDGFPGQEFRLELDDIMTDDFCLMAEDQPGEFTEWTLVDSFDQSGPEDRHYCFDEGEGIITFGDCYHGMAPEGRILIAGCALSLAEGGNVKAGSITESEGEYAELSVFNSLNAYGGAPAESTDACFMRYLRGCREVDRAVTFDDYESLVHLTPGLMIRRCKAFSASEMPRADGSVEENCVNIVVQPYTGEQVKTLSPRYIENIKRQIYPRRMIGTKVNILSPEYTGIVIFAEISVKPYYRDAEEQIRKALKDFFEASAGDFGKSVRYSTIYGILDTLDCVSGINSLLVDGQGRNIRRSLSGDVILPKNGMAYLKEAELSLTVSE